VAGSSGASVAPVPFQGQARYAVLALLSFGDELTGYAIQQKTEYVFRHFFGTSRSARCTAS
jgi:hypothetical protein